MAAVMLAASAALAAQSQAYMAKHPAIRSVITRIEGHDNAPAVIIPRDHSHCKLFWTLRHMRVYIY